MFKDSATNLHNISVEKGNEWLQSFDTVLSDCDGVLWLSNKTIDGSNAVLNRLQEMGKRVFFVTNNATKSRDTYVKLARDRGSNITKDQIITPILATVSYLKSINSDKKIYTIGRSVVDELKEYNIYCTAESDDHIINTHYSNITVDTLKLDNDVGCVLINYEHNFHYTHILRAGNYLRFCIEGE